MAKTSKDAQRTHGRDAWQGEGGNPRTDQRSKIVMFDNVTKTRHTLDLHEAEQAKRDQTTYRPDGTADRLDPLQQMGRTIEPGFFIATLRLCSPNLIFENAERPGFMCISIMQDGLNAKTGKSGRYKRYVTSFGTTEPLPEFSIMAPRMEEKPTKDGIIVKRMKHAYEKTRGWRTVLAKLLVAGFITEAQALQHFKPQFGRSSELWQKQIHQPITVGGH